MTRTFKRIMTWLFGTFAFVALAVGVVFTAPQTTVAKAADTAVTFSAAALGDEKHDSYGTSIRFDTSGLQWESYHNWLAAADWASIADYTTVNGRTVTEINNATTHTQKITLMMQPAGSFSFLRLYIPTEIIPLGEVKAMGILDGWSFNNGTNNYTSSAVSFIRNGDAMVPASSYSAETKLTASDISISNAQLVHRLYDKSEFASRGADSYVVDINIGKTYTEYDTMYDDYKTVHNSIYINGKSISEWNKQMIAEDARFNDPASYTYFPQNSTDPSHLAAFVKPIGLWGTSTGFRLTIFQELVADCETVTVTVGQGCTKAGNFMVAESKSTTVLTQNVVDVTSKLSFLDNTHNAPAGWGPTSMYYINTNGEACWTKAPVGGCLNEADPAEVGGGQIQMKYITFNGSTLWDINKNDNGVYDSTQGNIVNGGVYAPILVTLSSELGSSLKLTVPTNYTNGKAGHEEIVIKKGFSIKEGDTSYVVTSDIVFKNNGSSWSKEIKAEEIETEVTGIITKANRTDGGTNENFVIFQLSNNDYAGLNTTAITDISSLYGYIDIDGNVLSSKPNEPFFNVWGIANSVAFRAPGLDASQLQQVKYITIKAGAKFPSYSSQNGGKFTYYVTSEDVTFVHNVPNDTWTVGTLDTTEYTVTYTVDGATYTTQTVVTGNTVTEPAAPTKAEDTNYTYTFDCWTLNGAEYDFSTPVKGDITLVAQFTATPKENTVDITDELKFVHQEQQSVGTETYMIRTTNNYWTKAPRGGCLNEYDYQSANPVGGQVQMTYIYFNGKSLYDINREDDGSYGSQQNNILNGGQYAPIMVFMGTDGGNYSYVQLHVPTLYGGDGETANENHKSIEIKAGFSVTEGSTTWTVTKDIKWINLNGTWEDESKTFAADTVTIDNARMGGDANELVKVDIVSDSWNITCNYYDFMYAGAFVNYRKLIFINGVSVYDINEDTDDSGYVYSTFPMTGADDAVFAKPVLVETHAQNGGDAHKLTLWIHKTYLDSLGDDVVITLGAGYNAYTNGDKVLAEDVNYKLYAMIEIDDGTNTYTQTVLNGSTLKDLGTPSKAMTATTIYTFDNWYIKDTDTVVNSSTVVEDGMCIEARFIESAVDITETEVSEIYYNVTGENNSDRWLLFYLSEHDYPLGVTLYNIKSNYDLLCSWGLFDSITLYGEFAVGSQVKSEATLAEIFAANGCGEAIFINIWNDKYNGTLSVRVPGAVKITGIKVEEGASFPSYAYLTGATNVETRYVVMRTTEYIHVNATVGLDGPLTKNVGQSYDIQMATGASVRIAGNATAESGVRFETKISQETVELLKAAVDDGEYDSMTFGTLIVPKDYLMGGFFTHEWLEKNGFNYLDIESSASADDEGDVFAKFEDGYWSFFGSIVALKTSNYNREFAGVGYIALWLEDEVTYIYAEYDPTNARSASYIADAAINDRNTTATDNYKYYISANNNYSPYSEASNKFLETYLTWSENSAIGSQTLSALANKGGVATVTPTTQKLAGPYIELLYSTNVNVWGEFTYTDGNKTATEDFYLQAGTTSHKQFLDIFRENAVGVGMNANNLSMTSIKFTNAELANSDAPEGKVKVIALYSKNRTIDMDNQEIYLSVAQNNGSEMTVGAHLGIGGALTYLAKSGIYEGVIGGSSGWKNGTVALSTNKGIFDETNRYKSGSTSSSYSEEAGYYGHPTSSKPSDGAVNLINNFDAGRQIQQSWYAQVGGSDEATDGSNGYNRAYCYTGSSAGQYWPYNPVQAGDVVSNPGQIIDYEWNEAKGYIYVKTRAMDWAKGYDPNRPCENAVEGGVTTKSYMENYYRLNSDGTVVVNNSFIDWNGFTDMDTCDWASTELPAVYPVHTLNYYVSNIDGDGTWTDDIEYNNSLTAWTGGTAYHQFANANNGNTKVEDWFAWANGGNGNAIGLGMYIPNVNRYTSGRSNTSTAYYTDTNFQNSNAKPVDNYKKYGSFGSSQVSDLAQRGNILADKGMMSNMQEIKYTYQSAYVSNTSYTAPGVDFRMEAYVPIEYSYVLCVDTVNNIRSTFKGIKDNGTITNAGSSYERVGLDAWARADKKWTW